MAHMKKYAKGSVQALALHIERKTKNHSNKDIDVSRSHLNYSLIENDDRTMMKRLNDRLKNVYCMKRDDVKVCCSWVVTLPKEYLQNTVEEQRQFFEKTYEFLNSNYGQENVLTAEVHNDENTPHLHYSFVPVVSDKKRGQKVSAKEFFNRQHFQKFHDRLDDYLKNELDFYNGGVKNNSTKVNIEDIADYKKVQNELKKVTVQTEKSKEEFNVLKRNYFKGKKIVNDLVSTKNNIENDIAAYEKRVQEQQKILNDLMINIQRNQVKKLEREKNLDKKYKEKIDFYNNQLKTTYEKSRLEYDEKLKKHRSQTMRKLEEEYNQETQKYQRNKSVLVNEVQNLIVEKNLLKEDIDIVKNLDDSRKKELEDLKELKMKVKEVVDLEDASEEILDDIQSRLDVSKRFISFNNIKMSKDDYETLKNGFRSSVAVSVENVELQVENNKLFRENEDLKEFKAMKSDYESLRSEVAHQSFKIRDLTDDKLYLQQQKRTAERLSDKAIKFISKKGLANDFSEFLHPSQSEEQQERER